MESRLSEAATAFHRAESLLSELDAEESAFKAIPPFPYLTWIGIELDTVHMATEIRKPQAKTGDALVLVQER